MIPDVRIEDVNTSVFFDEYELTKEELDWLVAMAEEGNLQEALDVLVNEHQIPPAQKYRDAISRYLYLSESGVIPEADRDKMVRGVSLLTIGLTALLIGNFTKFTKKVYGPSVFRKDGITDPELKKVILSEVIGRFEQSINASMSQTQSFVLNGIRSLQREMLVENIKIRGLNSNKEILDAEVLKFKASLENKYPSLYKAMREGNILTSRKFGLDNEMVRHYKLDYYADMATRTTLLNIDRISTMVVATANNELVVEYYLVDGRKVKKDREICQDILGKKIAGISLLALGEDVASILGIMTVDEAMNTSDYAMGPYCRHGIRRCSQDVLTIVKEMTNRTA